MSQEQGNNNHNEKRFFRDIDDIHDHRFRDTISAIKELVKLTVSITEAGSRMEISRDIEIRDLEEAMAVMKKIQHTAKVYSGQMFVLRNHLQGIEDKIGKKVVRKSQPGIVKPWRSNPNGIASKSGFSPE